MKSQPISQHVQTVQNAPIDLDDYVLHGDIYLTTRIYAGYTVKEIRDKLNGVLLKRWVEPGPTPGDSMNVVGKVSIKTKTPRDVLEAEHRIKEALAAADVAVTDHELSDEKHGPSGEDPHLMYMAEQRFSTGTWGGGVLTGFTVRCGNCHDYFAVKRQAVELGGSIWHAKSAQPLTCPYCGVKANCTLDNGGRILEDTSGGGEY
jgi:hypothetical protein